MQDQESPVVPSAETARTLAPAKGGQAEPTISPIIAGRAALLEDLKRRNAAGLKVLGSAEILAAEDRKFRVVDVPEWGGEVIVRNLSGTERDSFEASIVQLKGNQQVVSTLNIRAKLAALSIIDPTDPELRRRAFSDEQVNALGEKSADGLSRVYDVAAALSGISKEDTEELAKNSAPAASDGSSLRSH